MALDEHAAKWASVAMRVLDTPYPWAAAHLSAGPEDVDAAPMRLHPAFHGSLDWHSSVHMQWSLLRLRTLAPGALEEAGLTAGIDDLLLGRLTPQHVGVEVEYLRAHRGYERPYGWAWAAQLAAAARVSQAPELGELGASLAGLAEQVRVCVLDWLPRQAYPVRHGVHSNSAFALALLHEAFGADALADAEVCAAIEARARAWFLADHNYPTQWEPSGADFLSPALCEVELMRRVLGPIEFSDWLAAFLPDLGVDPGNPLFALPVVLDDTDGQLVHLYGLGLSRAWQLRRLASALPVDDARVELLREEAAEYVVWAAPQIDGGDFMATHWLVSFALLAECAA
ncbi:MAG: DUF2891 family protein [Jatrophihabitans sp.]